MKLECPHCPSSSINHRSGLAFFSIVVATFIGCSEKPRNDNNAINGVVLSHGKPVANARVRVKGTTTFTTTDATGQFRLNHQSLPGQSKERTITASADGFFISSCKLSTAPLHIDLRPLPSNDNEAYEWVAPTPDDQSPDNCGNCHGEIFDQWSSGSHSGSATDFHFLDLYAGTARHDAAPDAQTWSLLRDRPEGAGVCASCHAPAAPLDQLAIGDIRDIEGIASQGVHCDFCHKVASVSTKTVGITHGRFGMDLLRPDHGQLFFGPLDDVDRGEDSYAPHFSKSEFCAACHEGTVFGVHVYGTYTEWLNSPAKQNGRQCQDCHMKPDGVMSNMAPGSGGIERDAVTLASHQLFPDGKAAMLKNCIEVDVQVDRVDLNSTASITLTATNVGHRVPTGFVDRHIILVVEAIDTKGNTVAPLSGPILPESCGSFVGRLGRLFAKQLFGESGESPIPFWQEVFNMTDTRLVPEQATKTQFEFPPEAESIRVRVIYRRFWEAVEQEKGWPDGAIIVYDQVHQLTGNRRPE
jgi:hypothetical protein